MMDTPLVINQPKKPEIHGFLLIVSYLGFFMLIIGFMLCVPLLLLAFYPNEVAYALPFAIPGAATIAIGAIITLCLRRRKRGRLGDLEDISLLIGVWLIAILISAIPLMLFGRFGITTYRTAGGEFVSIETYDFTQAVFETTSGLTTTGDTVVSVATAPHIVLFYRSFLQFVGGVGLVLILASAVSERSGLNLYLLEGHNDRLLPNLLKSARLIFGIYFIYIVLGIVAYVCCGMPFFDAMCYSMSALSTGGFGPTANSIADFNSVPIEIVSMVLMLLGATNFLVHYYLIRGHFIKGFRHFEFLIFFLVVILFYPLVIAGFYQYYDHDLGMAFRKGTFEFISATTTTGFTSVKAKVPGLNNYQNILNVAPQAFFASVLLSTIGGQQGSTSGGIKQGRFGYLLLNLHHTIQKTYTQPETVHPSYVTRFGEKEIYDQQEATDSTNFCCLYMILFFTGAIALTCFTDPQTGLHYPLANALLDFGDCLSAAGLSSGILTYGAAKGALWIGIIGMFLGRLDILVVFTFVGKSFRRLRLFGNHFSDSRTAER